MLVAPEGALECGEFAFSERQYPAQTRRTEKSFGIFHKVNAIDQKGAQSFGNNHLAMSANDHAMMGPKCVCDASAQSRRVDMRRIGMNRNAATPARRMIFDRLQMKALDKAEGRCQIVMEMRNRANVGPCLIISL